MGAVYANITLTNAADEAMLVDTGAVHLVISEQLAQKQGLRILDQ
ncbi:MAG: hypothetical protein WBB01_25535 [Phormidesmis sp.]